MLKKIAVTGGVASGKTTVCRMFEELGATVVFADDIVHELLQPNTPLGQKIIQKFGSIDRKVLSQKVFKDPKALAELESMLHPAVFQKIDQAYAHAKSLFVVEIPLLYEVGAEDRYDAVIAVLADPAIAKKRFSQGSEEYDLRMQRQLKPEVKASKAHFVIRNNGTIEDLRKEVVHLWKSIC